MKRYFFVCTLLGLILISPVSAQTSSRADLIARLRAQIVQLTVQLNQLLAQRNRTIATMSQQQPNPLINVVSNRWAFVLTNQGAALPPE